MAKQLKKSLKILWLLLESKIFLFSMTIRLLILLNLTSKITMVITLSCTCSLTHLIRVLFRCFDVSAGKFFIINVLVGTESQFVFFISLCN